MAAMTPEEKLAGAQAFYGAATFGRAKNPDKLVDAFGKFNLALGAPSASMSDKALALAAKVEAEAF